MSVSVEFESAIKELAFLFHRNGYIRQFNSKLRDGLGAQVYKKGDEVRFIAQSKTELECMQQLLLVAGFKPGKPFQKGQQFCLPMYGVSEVARLLGFMSQFAPNSSVKCKADEMQASK